MAADRLSFLSIRFRAALFASILVALALIGVIAYTHWTLHRDLVRAAEERTTRVAAQLAAILGPPIPARLAELQRLVDDAPLRRAVFEPSPETEKAAIQHLRSLT